MLTLVIVLVFSTEIFKVKTILTKSVTFSPKLGWPWPVGLQKTWSVWHAVKSTRKVNNNSNNNNNNNNKNAHWGRSCWNYIVNYRQATLSTKVYF